MSKKIHTIQSSDKKKFDEQVNELLELGCELMDGGYQVINNDDGVVYSQVIVFKNCEVEFYENGQLTFVKNYNEDGKQDGFTLWFENGQKCYDGTYKDGKLDGLITSWYENGQKLNEGTWKDGEQDGLSNTWYKNGQKMSEGTFKDGNLISEKHWDEDGSFVGIIE
jgi:antitoxin component YwqK of YwqJK toxin-antitoxin module